MTDFRVIVGDCIEGIRTLPDQSVHTCVTSPPYFGLRDYGMAGQIGLEDTPDAFVARLVDVFREVRRVLRDDGTLWLNLGDSYATTSKTQSTPKARGGRFGEAGGSGRIVAETDQITTRRPEGFSAGLPEKNLLGIPWRVAFALQADGWYLRQDIIWHKPNPMPESVTDRCTKAHEYVFLLSKSDRYFFDAEAIKEPAVTFGRQAPAVSSGPKHAAVDRSLIGPPPERRQLRPGNPQPSQRLDRHHQALRGRALRHFPARPDRALHPCRVASWRHCAGPVRGKWNHSRGLHAQRAQRHPVRVEPGIRGPDAGTHCGTWRQSGRPFQERSPMTPAEAIRRCTTVAECHALRASLGEMNSATYMALLMRIEALRKLETK